MERAITPVEVPPEHAALAPPDPGLDGISPMRGLLRIPSSSHRPSGDVLVAVHHRGYWFYASADDAPSKLAFRLLQTLINMRLVEAVVTEEAGRLIGRDRGACPV